MRWVVGHNVQLVQDVGYNIPSAGNDGLIQLRQEVGGQDSLIVLGETGLQAKIEFAPRHGLGKQVVRTRLIRSPIFRFERRQGFCESIVEANLLAETGQVISVDLDGNLDARFPTPFLDIKYTSQDPGLLLHRFRAEEQGDTVGRQFRSPFRRHGALLYHDTPVV